MANEEVIEQKVETQDQNKPAEKTGEKPGQQQPQNTPDRNVQQRPGADGSGDDARYRGVLTDLQKERAERQKLQQQIATLSNNLSVEQKRVLALAGVNPKSDKETELDEVRARVTEMFPVLGKLDDDKLSKILGLLDNANALQETTQHHWTRHGQMMLDNLAERVSDSVGKDLSDRQRKALYRAYAAEAESNPEFLKRHEAGDPKLIEEFAKEWTEDWFETARRTVVNEEVGRRRPVPSGRDRNVQTTPAKKIDYKDPKAVEDAMVESFKRHGGGFEN